MSLSVYFVSWLSLAWCSLRRHGAHAAIVCPNTGRVSPDVRTLIAAPDNTADYTAWILGPDCDKEIVNPSSAEGYMPISYKGIERVESIPRYATVQLIGNPLSRGGNFTASSTIHLESFSLNGLSNFILPKYVSLIDVPLTSLSGVPLPADVTSVRLEQTRLKSLKGVELLSDLTGLRVSSSKITAIDIPLPPLLESFALTGSPITKIERIQLPDSLDSFVLSGNKISVVKGITWSSKLGFLDLTDNPLVEFEIRESDEPLFDILRFFLGDFSQVRCTQPTAILKKISSQNVCVISDELFESLYATPISSAPTTGDSSTLTPRPRATRQSAASMNGSVASPVDDEASAPVEEGSSATSSDTTPTSSRVDTRTSSSSNAGEQANGSELATSSLAPTQSEDGSGGQSISKTTIIETEAASDRTATTILGTISGLIAVVLAVWFYRACFMAKKENDQGDTMDSKYISAETPHTSNVDAGTRSQEFLANDVRVDQEILQFRIAQKDVKLSTQIARGGYGVIYRGIFDGKDVAVKQMLPGTWHDDHTLSNFMNEIRLCVSLNHPKIVAFVGIAYSSLRDLSVVIEFMPGGDLLALLQKQKQAHRSPQDWTRPWTSSQIQCKTSIGQDVAEAVAYLHSLETPIIHRDLKARNVLLDLEGNAKLSDFGISREVSIDETMTSEVGTAAWIAPEVLRGARYSEKADVYSLGVLLVELDRCRHPYADESLIQRSSAQVAMSIEERTTSDIAQKNTQIALLVSTGKLRPSVSSDCPREIALLVSKCLSFDPDARPLAADVATSLREFARG